MAFEQGLRALRRRRAAFASLRARRRWMRAARSAGVTCTIARSARLGRAELELSGPGSLVIGENVCVQDGATIRVLRGSVVIGPGCLIRRGSVLNVSGELHLERDVLVSWGAVVHCAGRVSVSQFVTISEYVTIVDASHTFEDPDQWHWHQNVIGEVSIGRNTWLCSKATVTKDVAIGGCVIVAAGSTVTSDVPDGVLVSGVPARVVDGYRTTG